MFCVFRLLCGKIRFHHRSITFCRKIRSVGGDDDGPLTKGFSASSLRKPVFTPRRIPRACSCARWKRTSSELYVQRTVRTADLTLGRIPTRISLGICGKKVHFRGGLVACVAHFEKYKNAFGYGCSVDMDFDGCCFQCGPKEQRSHVFDPRISFVHPDSEQ